MNPLASRLSKQEQAVMMGLAESLSRSEIIEVMHIAEKTYGEYCRRIKAKLGARSIQEATLMWVRAEDKTVQRMIRLAAQDLIRAVSAMAIEMNGRSSKR